MYMQSVSGDAVKASCEPYLADKLQWGSAISKLVAWGGQRHELSFGLAFGSIERTWPTPINIPRQASL